MCPSLVGIATIAEAVRVCLTGRGVASVPSGGLAGNLNEPPGWRLGSSAGVIGRDESSVVCDEDDEVNPEA